MNTRPLFAALCCVFSFAAQSQVPSGPTAAPAERERTIYVPYEELEKMFSDSGKGVFLPYKEFLELWNELNLKRAKDDEAKPPQEGIVSKADYTARLQGETLVIDAVIAVESFQKGWLTVPLAKGGALPGIAEVESGNAVLHAKADGYEVLLPDKGRYELKLKIYAPVRKSGGKQSVALALPQAAVSRFTATVPESGWEFKVEPAAAFTARPAGADTELSFFFGSGGKFEVSWSKPEAATQLTPVVLASSQVSAEVRGGSVSTKAVVDFRILRAPVASFTFLIPDGQEVLSVTGDDVKDFKLEPLGKQQRLTVTPNAPVRDKWSVTLALEATLPKLPAEVAVPEIVVEGATQDRGEISLAAEPQLDVTPRPGEGLVQHMQNGAPHSGLSAVGGFRFLKHPAALTLAVAEAKPQVDVESLTLLTVRRDSARVESTFHYHVRRVGIFEARIALPAGWANWELTGLTEGTWSVEKTGTVETLAVKFNKQMLGQTSFTVRALRQRATPTEDATVAVFAPLNTARHEAKIGVSVHSSLEVSTRMMGDLRLDDVSALAIPGPTPQAQASAPDTELTLAFRYRDISRLPATLSFKARETQVNV
ncbi:MAG: hypothetical protein ACOYMN_06730, partial [Roseimicrobium sp.]